uniref:Uncharacterized protein n=1 Tax=Anguilla anguilla TaxID=7936 RepID=A0A0E9VBL4_ANGAN
MFLTLLAFTAAPASLLRRGGETKELFCPNHAHTLKRKRQKQSTKHK